MNDNFEEEIRNRFESLTKGIRSVIILTNKRNNYYSNHFFDRSMTDENANEVMLHETVADALHAIKSLDSYNIYSKHVQWDRFKDEDNWTNGDGSQNAKVASYIAEITSDEKPHLLSDSNNKYYLNSNDELLVAYNIFYGRVEAIALKLDEMIKNKEIDGYVLIGNFNDTIGSYYATINEDSRDVDEAKATRMVGEWLNSVSKSSRFSLSMLAQAIDKDLMSDKAVLVSDYLCQQVNKEEALNSLRNRHGLLFKFPKLGKKFFTHSLDDVTNDFQFQRLADNLKMVNPRSYFMSIETNTAYYLSLPADASNKSLVALLYLVYGKFLKSRGINFDEGHDSLSKSLYIDMPAFNKNVDIDVKEQHPLLKEDRPNLLMNMGRRTRRFTQAGRNLAVYQTSDIAKELNDNSSVYNFIIAYSMRNQKEEVLLSDNIKKNFDAGDMGDLINQISFTIGGVMGSDHDDIWHDFEYIFYSITHQNMKEVMQLLDK